MGFGLYSRLYHPYQLLICLNLSNLSHFLLFIFYIHFSNCFFIFSFLYSFNFIINEGLDIPFKVIKVNQSVFDYLFINSIQSF